MVGFHVFRMNTQPTGISYELKIQLKHVGIIWPIPPLEEDMKEDLDAGH